MLKKILITIAIVVAAAVLSLFTIYALMPADVIEDMFADALAQNAGVSFKSREFKKLYPAGFEATGVTVTPLKPRSRSISAERVSARLALAPLLAAKLRLNIDSSIGSGVVTAPVISSTGEVEARFTARALPLSVVMTMVSGGGGADTLVSGLPVTGLDGLTIDADVDLRAPRKGCPTGTIEIKGASDGTETDLRVIGIRVPIGIINDVGVDADLKDCTVALKGAWVDSTGLNARATGTVGMTGSPRTSPVDITIELLARGELAENPAISSLLGQYRKSPNFYSMRIQGTVGAPVIRAN